MDPSSKEGFEPFHGDGVGPGAQLDLEELVSSLQNLVGSVVKTREGRTRVTSPDEDESGGVKLLQYSLGAGAVVLRL